MRVAVVHSYYSAAVPSGENLIVDQQLAALRAAGHETELFARSTDETRDGERFYAARAAARVALGVGAHPLDALQAFEPDVVHVHNLFPNFGSNWVRQVKGAAVVLTVHNHRFECAAATLFRDGHPCHECLRFPVLPAVVHGCYRNRAASLPPALASAPRLGAASRLLNAVDAIVCLNKTARDHLADRARDVGKIFVVPNFPADPDDDRARDLGQELDALYVGRLSPEKGILQALDVWPDGRRLTIVGGGPESDRVRQVVERRANLHWLGQMPPGTVRAAMRSARVLVVPSMWPEGFPTVVLEAMQEGLPVVVSDRVAVANELLEHGAAEVFSSAHPRTTLAAALQRAELRESDMRRNARQAFEAHYSRSAWTQRMLQVYDAACRRSSDRM